MTERPEDVSLAAAALADLQRARDEAAEAERRADLEYVGARLVEAIAGALAEHNHSRQIDEILYPTDEPKARGNGPLRPDDREPFINRKARDEAKTLPPSRVIGAGAFMRTYTPISYTAEGLLPSGFMYAMTAKTGAGKTAFAQALTFAVTMNRPEIVGLDIEHGRVAYVTLENPTDFKMKLAVGCYVHNISWNEIDPRLAIIDGRDTPEQIYDGLKLDAELNGPFQHVNIDTLQAGFSAANAGKFNDNEAILAYVIRLRPLTELPGQPSVLVLCHPVKGAGEDDLIPYGGGATINELDGNLTLWKASQIKLHHTDKLRSPTFETKYFRIEACSCPDVLDNKGRQILLPVMRPCTEMDAAEREKNEGNLDIALLRAMEVNPDGTQLEWAFAIGLKSKGSINKKLQKLKSGKFVEEGLGGKWRVTPKGRKESE